MQFGMPTLIENRTLQDNVNLCKRLNLQFIELNMNFPEYQVDKLEQIDDLIRIAEDAEIYYTIHLDENLNIADFNPLVTEAYLETKTIEALKTSVEWLKCQCVIFFEYNAPRYKKENGDEYIIVSFERPKEYGFDTVVFELPMEKRPLSSMLTILLLSM